MKKSSIFLPLLFSFCCVSSVSFCMQNNQIVPVNHFDAVSPDMKNKIFACAEPCEKNNLMRTNKEWHKRGSKRYPNAFRLFMHKPFCASWTDERDLAWQWAIEEQAKLISKRIFDK